MKCILDKVVLESFNEQFKQIKENTPANWGKMNAAEMFQHLNKSIDIIFTKKPIKRMFIGRILGKIILKKALRETKLSKNAPTSSIFIADTNVNFQKEQTEWLTHLHSLSTIKESDLNDKVHPFFGKMTGYEWNVLIYKHVEHHLNQFKTKTE